jgi:hypothetical protein
MLLHDFSPDRRARGPETHAKPNPKFGPAYSDDGCRRKQRSSKPDPKTGARKPTCKPRANYLKPKETRKVAAVGVLTCSTP